MFALTSSWSGFFGACISCHAANATIYVGGSTVRADTRLSKSVMLVLGYHILETRQFTSLSSTRHSSHPRKLLFCVGCVIVKRIFGHLMTRQPSRLCHVVTADYCLQYSSKCASLGVYVHICSGFDVSIHFFQHLIWGNAFCFPLTWESQRDGEIKLAFFHLYTIISLDCSLLYIAITIFSFSSLARKHRFFIPQTKLV